MSMVASARELGPSALRVGQRITVRVPASTANLGPGFDSIGMALGVWDEASVELVGDALVIDALGQGAAEVPRDENHLVHRAMVRAWEALGVEVPTGVRLEYTGGIPHSRGMGSSATAIVAGVALATAVCGHDLEDDRTLAFISDIASTMEGHPDNASASVYGGVTVSWAEDGTGSDWRTARMAPPPDVVPMVIVPELRLSTATARAALAQEVPLAVAARNSGRAALLIHALTRDPALLMPATVDFLHQEARRPAYPDSMALVDALRAAGVPAVISGAGPTVLALADVRTRDVVLQVCGDAEILAPGVPTRGLHAVSR